MKAWVENVQLKDRVLLAVITLPLFEITSYTSSSHYIHPTSKNHHVRGIRIATDILFILSLAQTAKTKVPMNVDAPMK